MENRIFNNADSFVMAFDEVWSKVVCDDINLKIEKVIDELDGHPFVIQNPQIVRDIANFRVNSLRKFK